MPQAHVLTPNGGTVMEARMLSKTSIAILAATAIFGAASAAQARGSRSSAYTYDPGAYAYAPDAYAYDRRAYAYSSNPYPPGWHYTLGYGWHYGPP
jgi:hypothetical protein